MNRPTMMIIAAVLLSLLSWKWEVSASNIYTNTHPSHHTKHRKLRSISNNNNDIKSCDDYSFPLAPIRVPHTTTASSNKHHHHRHRYNNNANHNTHNNNNQPHSQEKHNLVAIPPAGSNDNPLLSKNNEYYETGEYYAPLCIHQDTLRIDIRKLKLCNSGACFDEQIGVSYTCSQFLFLTLLCYHYHHYHANKISLL